MKHPFKNQNIVNLLSYPIAIDYFSFRSFNSFSKGLFFLEFVISLYARYKGINVKNPTLFTAMLYMMIPIKKPINKALVMEFDLYFLLLLTVLDLLVLIDFFGSLLFSFYISFN